MQKKGVLRASAFAIVLTLLLLPGIALANNVAVNCTGAGGSLSAAVAALPPGPNTITVTGTCNNENVVINNMRSLTIVAGAGGATIVQQQDLNTFDISLSQDINLRNLEIVGVPGSTFGSGGFGVNITEASDVHIIGCDIHDNEGGGVLAGGGSLLSLRDSLLRNTNIHNNTPGDGLDVVGSSTAEVRLTTIQNNGCTGLAACFNFGVGGGVGVAVGARSAVTFHNNNLIQNNGDIGIWARPQSLVSVGGGPPNTVTTVQGHNIVGIYVQEGAHLGLNFPALVQGNGGGCPPATPIPCGGIFATANATVEFQGFGTINGNQGAGITAQQGTNVHLGGGVTVSNNSGDGVDIRSMSIGDFTPVPGSGFGSNTITGNGGASVFCDERSLAIGNLSGFSNVKCGENAQ